MEIIDKLSGKHIEEKINEYGEVQGTVLLGMHRDLQGQRGRMRKAFWLSIAALAFSLLSLGVVIWKLV